MKKLILVLSLLAVWGVCSAGVPDLVVEGRGGFGITGDGCGFSAEYLNLRVEGSINESWHYVFRHRLNKAVTNPQMIDATDCLYMMYTPGDWEFTAGKNVLAVGGYEYDAAPIDVLLYSEFCNNFGECYNYAVSAARNFNGAKLTFQFSRSPLGGTQNAISSRFGYSLMLSGKCGDFYEYIHSVNFFELQTRGQFASYQVLGNKFNFSPVTLTLDLCHRFGCCRPEFFKDYSLMCSATVKATDWMDVFALATYDCNKSDSATLVPCGTDIFKGGAGLAIYPVRDSRNVRIHCFYSHEYASAFNVGLTMKLHVLSLKK